MRTLPISVPVGARTWTRALVAAAGLMAVAFEPTSVVAQTTSDFPGSLGGRHIGSVGLQYVHAARFDDDEPEADPTGAYNLRMEMAAIAAELPLGGGYGFEAQFQLGYPFSGYVGGFLLGGGVHLQPLRLGPFFTTLGLGVSMGSDLHAYFHPRAGLAFGDKLALSVGYYYVHPLMSRDWDDSGLDLPGVGYQRLHVDLFVQLNDSWDQPQGVHVFVDRHSFSGDPAMLLANGAGRGEFWGGGIGYAF